MILPHAAGNVVGKLLDLKPALLSETDDGRVGQGNSYLGGSIGLNNVLSKHGPWERQQLWGKFSLGQHHDLAVKARRLADALPVLSLNSGRGLRTQ